MTKAEIVKQIAGQTGLESKMVAGVVEALLERIRAAQIGGQNVYFRGFGSFVRRERAAKKARDISRNTTVLVPAHTVPAFKPSKAFVEWLRYETIVAAGDSTPAATMLCGRYSAKRFPRSIRSWRILTIRMIRSDSMR